MLKKLSIIFLIMGALQAHEIGTSLPKKIAGFFKAFDRLESDFTQLDSDGKGYRGRLWIDRSKQRMTLDYLNAAGDLVQKMLAKDKVLKIYDFSSKEIEETQTIDWNQTPLIHLLKMGSFLDHFNIKNFDKIRGLSYVTLTPKGIDDDYTLTFVFDEGPEKILLKGWVLDTVDQKMEVVLKNPKINDLMPDYHFVDPYKK